MKAVVIALLLATGVQAKAQNNTNAYQVCVDTCYAWSDRASVREIRQCVEQYCKQYLPNQKQKMAEVATPVSEQQNEVL